MKTSERKEAQAIIGRAESLIEEARDYGFRPDRAAWAQPVGTYDLWASADKARQYAQMALGSRSGAGLDDARLYARSMEDSYRTVQRYGTRLAT